MKNYLETLQDGSYRSVQRITKQVLTKITLPIPPVLKGVGTIKRFPGIIKIAQVSKILVVTNRPLLSMGLLDSFLDALKKYDIPVVIYDKIQPNPTFENVEDGLFLYLQSHCDGIVAFGGGSSLNCGKVIAARVTNYKSIPKMRGLFKLRHKLPPFFAVPTTSGTGSEATICAVITDVKNHEKFAINDPKLVPLATVLDPELTVSLPPSLTASTGLNALTHAIEAYIGNYDTPFVQEKALSATDVIINDLEDCYNNPDNLSFRLNLAQASFDAGLAFTRAYVGYVHAIAHNMGGYYGTPHGLANAIVLPYILDFYGKSVEKKLAELAYFSGLGHPMDNDYILAQHFIEKIKAMNKAMAIPKVIQSLKLEDIPFLAKRILKEANPTYPVPKIMHYDECCKILEQLCFENKTIVS